MGETEALHAFDFRHIELLMPVIYPSGDMQQAFQEQEKVSTELVAKEKR